MHRHFSTRVLYKRRTENTNNLLQHIRIASGGSELPFGKPGNFQGPARGQMVGHQSAHSVEQTVQRDCDLLIDRSGPSATGSRNPTATPFLRLNPKSGD